MLTATYPACQPPNSQPCSRNPKPYAIYPVSYFSCLGPNPKPYLLTPKPLTLSPKPNTPTPTPRTLHLGTAERVEREGEVHPIPRRPNSTLPKFYTPQIKLQTLHPEPASLGPKPVTL